MEWDSNSWGWTNRTFLVHLLPAHRLPSTPSPPVIRPLSFQCLYLPSLPACTILRSSVWEVLPTESVMPVLIYPHGLTTSSFISKQQAPWGKESIMTRPFLCHRCQAQWLALSALFKAICYIDEWAKWPRGMQFTTLKGEIGNWEQLVCT